MAAGTTLRLGNTGSATAVSFPTNFTNANITLNTTSTVIYQSNGNQTISAIPVYGNLTTITGGSKTLANSITVNGNVLIANNSTLNVGGNTYSITVYGNWTHETNATFNEDNGTVVFAGGNNQTIDGNPTETFYNLTVNKTGGSVQPIDNGTDINVDVSFTITSGTFETAGNTLTVSGNSVIAGTLSTNDATGIANLNGNVNLSGGTIGSTANTGTVNITGTLTMPSGNGTIGRVNLNANGNTTIAAGRTLNFIDINGAKVFVGLVTNNGNWNNSSDGNIEFRGGLTNNGTSFTSGTGTYSFSTNPQTLSGTSAITFNGPVTVTSTLNNANTTTVVGILGGTGTWNNNNGSILNYENATAPMLSGTFNVGTNSNTVNYSSSSAQDIRDVIYWNLTTSGGGTKTLLGNTTINGTLTMTTGNIVTGANILVLANYAASSLSYNSGIVIGNFERYINQTAQDYFFPVGIAGQIHSLTARFSNLTAGSILARYISGDPGNTGLPLNDADNSQISEQFTTGYWSALAKNGFASTNYNIDLDAAGFGPYTINAGTRVLKRTDTGGSWTLDGSHTDATGSIIKRTGLINGISNAGAGTQFGAGRPGPRITTQPVPATVCENTNVSFTVAAVGFGTLSYQWYKAPGTLLVNGGQFSGVGTTTLNISPVAVGDGGNYFCIVSDGNGNQRQSNNALLTVNPAPTITLGAISAVCNTSVSFSLPYTATSNSPTTYSITAGTPAMAGFTAVTDAPLGLSPISVTIPVGVSENNYQFIITVKNGNNCSSTNQAFTVMDYANQVANAGPDQDICASTDVTLAGNTPSVGTGTWTMTSGTGTASFVPNANAPNAVATVTTYGAKVFTWTIVNGTCNTSNTVSVDFAEQADAGPDQDICASTDVTLAGNTPSVGTGTWTMTSGTGTASFVPNANAPNAVATVTTYGAKVFTWTIVNGTCNTSNTVSVNFAEQADAGPDQDICASTDVTLAGNTPSVGTGTWTMTSGTGTASFVPNANAPNAVATVTTYGAKVFTWTIVNGTCNTSNTVSVDFAEQADAGPDQDICASTDVTLAGNTPSVGTGTWTMTSGTGTASFVPNANAPNAVATVTTYGAKVFTWTIVNGTCNTSNTVSVDFAEQADAGPDQDICASTDVTLAGNTPSVGTGTWTMTSGTGTASFVPNANAPNAVATVTTYGAKVFTWTIVNGTCNTSNTVSVNFAEQADAGPDQDICASTDVTLAGNTPSVGTGTWTMTSGTGTASFAPNANAPNAVATVTTYGAKVFTWTIVNGTCNTSNTVSVDFAEQADAGPDQDICASTDVTLAGNTPSVGTGTWTMTSGTGTASFVPNANAPNAVATVTTYGAKVFTWTIVNGTCNTSNTVSVDFAEQADAGPDQDICASTDVTLAGNTPSVGTGTWTMTSGTGTASFVAQCQCTECSSYSHHIWSEGLYMDNSQRNVQYQQHCISRLCRAGRCRT